MTDHIPSVIVVDSLDAVTVIDVGSLGDEGPPGPPGPGFGINVKDYGAIGDGATDDTAAVQAALNAAAITPAGMVLIPPGTYLVGNLLFGDQRTVSQSYSPTGIVGHGSQSVLKAKPGTTGTLLQAWTVAGVRFRDFMVDASGIAGISKAIDTEWKIGTGPSVQNIYDGVFVQNFAGTGWFARNNNDCSFRSVIVRQPTVSDAQVGIDLQGAGGVLAMNECIWQGCLLDVCSQNAVLRACWGHGIRINHDQTGDNVMHLDGCYIYANESADAVIWDPAPSGATGHWVRSITLTGTHFIITTTGKSLFNVGLVAGININGCISYASSPVNFFGPTTVRVGGGDNAQVIINGLSTTGGGPVTLNPVTGVSYQPTLIDVEGVVVAGKQAPVRRTVKADTTTAYTPILTDENVMVTLSNAAAVTVTLPQNSAVAFPVGAEIDFLWLGVGQPTFQAGTGATVNATPGLKLRARYSAATAKCIAANTWVVIGDLAA